MTSDDAVELQWRVGGKLIHFVAHVVPGTLVRDRVGQV